LHPWAGALSFYPEDGMPFMQWDASFETGIENIDAQHKVLIESFNKLYSTLASRDSSRQKQVHQIISVYEVLRNHIRDEERILAEIEYPYLNKQIAEHQKYLEMFSMYRRLFEADKIRLSFSTMRETSKLVRDHILGEDKKYAAFFLERKSKAASRLSQNGAEKA
jgi:hemerythrin